MPEVVDYDHFPEMEVFYSLPFQEMIAVTVAHLFLSLLHLNLAEMHHETLELEALCTSLLKKVVSV